jgi:hypothetical protein
MNNYKKILIVLPMLPMLMANAPAPKTHPNTNYTDFEMSIVKEEVNAEEATDEEEAKANDADDDEN